MAINYQKELRDAKTKTRQAKKHALREKEHAKKWKRRARKDQKAYADIVQETERLRVENMQLRRTIAAQQAGFTILEWRNEND